MTDQETALRELLAEGTGGSVLRAMISFAAERLMDASRAASSGRSMIVRGVEREHHAGLDDLARNLVQGPDGMAFSAAWSQRVEREAKEIEHRQGEWERQGLVREP